MVKDRNKGLRVLDYIDENEILAQLSEEASEVAKAALKLRRERAGRLLPPQEREGRVVRRCDVLPYRRSGRKARL